MTFLPGAQWRGNSKGRKKGSVNIADSIRRKTRDGMEILEFYLDLMRNSKASYEHRLKAAMRLEDRGWGKAPMVLEKTEKTEKSLVLIIQRPADSVAATDRMKALFGTQTPIDVTQAISEKSDTCAPKIINPPETPEK